MHRLAQAGEQYNLRYISSSHKYRPLRNRMHKLLVQILLVQILGLGVMPR